MKSTNRVGGEGGGSGRFNAEKCCSNEASSGCHE